MSISIPGPFVYPPRVDGQPQKSPPGDLDETLVALYVEEHGVSERIVRGCLAFDVEPPTQAQIEAKGIPFRITKLLDATAPTDMLGDAGNDA